MFLPRDYRLSTARLFQRIDLLKSLLKAPEDRARRLAFYLARRRAGFVEWAGQSRRFVKNRHGTEFSSLYDLMGAALLTAQSERPPPLGPRAREGPRIRAV